jgi:hypothetical protein
VIDLASVLLAAALFAGGWLLGRHARLKSTPKPEQPICLCEHHYGAHDPETGQCQVDFWRKPGAGYEPQLADCPCVRYTGPQPVEQYWVPPAADMSIVTAPRQVERGEQR